MESSPDGGALPAIVYPVLVVDSQVAHLAVAELDEAGAGYRVICPSSARLTDQLRRAELEDVFIWCALCKSWADASGISLPRSQ